MYKLTLVLRYLRKRKITVFPVLGVALGVMALVVVLSVMEGFETDFRRSIRGILPDMQLQFLYVEGYSQDVDEIVRRVEAVPEVRAVSPYISGLGIVDVRWAEADIEGNLVQRVVSEYVDFRGFDWDRENAVLNLKSHLKYGDEPFARKSSTSSPVATFIVGSRLSGKKFRNIRTKTTDWGNIERGARAQLLTFTPSYDRSRVSGEVTDILSSGIYDLDAHTLFLSLDMARRLKELEPGAVSGLGIALKSYTPANVKAARASIRAALYGLVRPDIYELRTWEEARGQLLTAVAMERRIMAFILFFFLVIAGFSISAILIMIVLEKVRDIGILLAMGASQRGVAGIFVLYGITIGVIGAGIGLAAGVIFVENLDFIEQFIYAHTGWQPFPPEIYDLPEIPRVLNWWTNFYIIVTALVVSFAASLLPAVRAAWLDPVEAIRYE